MAKLLTIKLLAISVFSFCVVTMATTRSFALDEEGCLTCHQYPGLVTLKKPNESNKNSPPGGWRYLFSKTMILDKSEDFEVLHIDEKKYTRSEHGKLRCRQCHNTIWKIPHVGDTNTDCTTHCHKKDAKKILKDKNYRKNIHENEQAFIVRLMDQSSCRVCHPLYPHFKDEVVRTLLNMHTGFMLCDVCHIKRRKFKQLSYEWYDTENAQYVGEPFGSYYNPDTKKNHKGDKKFITRIAVFATENETKRPLINTWDIAGAKKYLRQYANLTAEEKEKSTTFFHRDIDKMELSVACEECHSAKGILDLKKLGFDEQKANHLINLNIKGMVTKYKEFYIPRMLNFDCL